MSSASNETKDSVSPQYKAALRLAFCSSGICLCYGVYGFLQESLFSQSKLGATFMLVTQTVGSIVVALIWRHIESSGKDFTSSDNDNNSKLHHPLLCFTSSIYVFAMAASNESLQFVSYPTAVLAKSCKMIPTMVMGSLVEKRSYSPQEWISALLISMGIAIFNLSRIKQQNFDKGVDDLSQDRYWKGMLLLFISLCMDGFLGSCQGFIKREDSTGNRRPPTAVETMLFVNVYSLLFLIPMAIAGGQWNQGIGILKEDPNLCWSLLMLNGVASMGQIFIFLTITWYSSLVCTTITTTRKFFTILFSVLHFGHRFSEWQWMSVCLVFGGLYLSIAVNGRQQHSVPEKTDGKQD